MEGSNIVPSLVTSQLPENIPETVAGHPPKSNLLKTLPKGDGNRLEKLFENLNLRAIESWTEQHATVS